MPIEGIANLLQPREVRPPASRRQPPPEKAADSSAARAEPEADFKEVLAARLERVRAHAANMRAYTERAKVRLDAEAPSPGNPELDVRV